MQILEIDPVLDISSAADVDRASCDTVVVSTPPALTPTKSPSSAVNADAPSTETPSLLPSSKKPTKKTKFNVKEERRGESTATPENNGMSDSPPSDTNQEGASEKKLSMKGPKNKRLKGPIKSKFLFSV